MRSLVRPLSVLCLLLVATWVPATAAKKKEAPRKKETPAVAVERWLLLGPAPDPLPVFHDADRGGYGLDARLAAEVFPAHAWRPRDGAPAPGFGPQPRTWTARETVEGVLTLEVPQGAGEGRPASAWLAAWVETDRFRKVKVVVLGTHARRLWLDGEPVASGGAKGDGDTEEPVQGELELITGKHLLVVETLWNPARSSRPWRIGVEMAAVKDEAPRPELRFSLDPARTLTILDVLDPPRITSVAPSHDGTRTAVALERYLPGTDDRESWVEIWTGERAAVFRGGTGMGQVAWAPHRLLLSYVTSEGEGDERRSTLWVADLTAHAVEPLLERIEGLAGYAWSPDGRAIAYLTTVEPEKDERGIKRVEGLMDRWASYRTKRYLNLVTYPEGLRRRLTAGPLTTDGMAFSPDGKRLLFTRTVEDVADRPFSATELWELDLATFEARQLRRSRWLRSARYGPDGRRLLLHAGPDEFGAAGRDVPEGTFANAYDGQLFVWDPASDDSDPITREFDPAVVRAEWSTADGNIYLVADDRDYQRLYRYDVAGRRFAEIDTGFDVFEDLALSPGAAFAVGTATSPWSDQELLTIDLAEDRVTRLYRPAREWFREVRRGTVEPWSFTAANGRTIDGRVYLPPGFDPARKYPCIVYYYGGTNPVSRDFGGRYPKEYWASQGYVVYVPQPSGAVGFGQEFSAAHVNDWGKTTAEEIIQGTREFLEAHPYVDRERVGCIGASYGGFMTMLLTTRTDLFAAAVAHAGISSLSSYWGEGYWGYSYSSIATAGSYPWNRPDIYVEQSPLFRADKNRVPILLTHGVADTNVPVGESDQFFVALKLLGRDVEYLQVAGQDHWILDHAKRVVWSRSIVAWFDRWLKGQPEWWDALWPTAGK